MKNLLRPILALSLVTAVGIGARANAMDTSYGNASYGSQLNYDSFNYSVRKRLESVRIGSLGTNFGSRRTTNDYNPNYPGPGYNQPYGQQPYGQQQQPYGQMYNQPSGYNPGQPYGGGSFNTGYAPTTGYDSGNFGTNGYSYGFSSEEAYAMAPSARSESYASSRRRQLDCVYYSGFTVWADLYSTWARQRSSGHDDGFKYNVFGPAIGFDWSSGPMTVGVATTYAWGKVKGRDTDHKQKVRTWGLELYGQYNADNFYVNATLGYGHNSFRSTRDFGNAHFSDRFTANAFNVDGEFGWKMNFGGFLVTPHAGLRYYHDRRGSIGEGNGLWAVHAGSRNYYTLELPLGVDFGYEIRTGGMVLVPRAKLAWIPELARKRGSAHTRYFNGANWVVGDDNASKRSRHGFRFGLGMDAKITDSLSAHIDYNLNFRSKMYEHHWNLGMGFSF